MSSFVAFAKTCRYATTDSINFAQVAVAAAEYFANVKQNFRQVRGILSATSKKILPALPVLFFIFV